MKQPKRYDFTKKPHKPNSFLMAIAKAFASNPILKKHKFTLEKVNMEGIEPPYFLLANHASRMDFRICFGSIKPYNMNYVVAIDALQDQPAFLMRAAGAIVKRKFIKDYQLIKHMCYCVKHYKNPLVIYPEARYTFDGTQSWLPPSLGKMCKLLKVPVVVLMSYGNFISNPQWNDTDFRKGVPVKGKLICIATKEEVESLSAEELNERIAKVFVYDDFKYQFDNKIVIDYPKRAEGLHGILYQCCECGTEHEMYSHGSTLECRHCGKKWEMTEYGQLRAHEGETKFPHIPDWFAWERENVRREVENGTYFFEDEVEVNTLPKHNYISQGRGKFRQDMTGTHFWCNAYGEPFEMHLAPSELESVHIEFNYRSRKTKKFYGDSLDISNKDDSFWLHPVNVHDAIMKISFATEELYQLEHKKLKERKD